MTAAQWARRLYQVQAEGLRNFLEAFSPGGPMARPGVTFTDAQRKRITELVELDREAQRILAELETQFGEEPA